MKDIKELYDVVVIGGGPAGLTAALYLARARYRVVVVEKEHFGGQITITDEVVNFPGVERTSGKALTETMRRQAQSFGAEFLLAEVTGLIMDGDVKTVQTSRGELHCFGVLLATGAHPRSVGFAGEAEFKGRGVAYCATCDAPLYRGKAVAVVGSSPAAEPEAAYMAEVAGSVLYLPLYEGTPDLPAAVQVVREKPTAVVGETNVTALRTDAGEYPVDGVFLLRDAMAPTQLVPGLEGNGGHVAVNAKMQTNLPGCFACGDAVGLPYQYVKAAGEGNVAALSAVEYLAALKRNTKE